MKGSTLRKATAMLLAALTIFMLLSGCKSSDKSGDATAVPTATASNSGATSDK